MTINWKARKRDVQNPMQKGTFIANVKTPRKVGHSASPETKSNEQKGFVKFPETDFSVSRAIGLSILSGKLNLPLENEAGEEWKCILLYIFLGKRHNDSPTHMFKPFLKSIISFYIHHISFVRSATQGRDSMSRCFVEDGGFYP